MPKILVRNLTHLAAALVTIDVDAGTNRIRARATGVLATTIEWWAEISVMEWIP